MSMQRVVREDCPCYPGKEGCDIQMSTIPSLAKLDLKLCKEHTEIVSFKRSNTIPDEI